METKDQAGRSEEISQIQPSQTVTKNKIFVEAIESQKTLF